MTWRPLRMGGALLPPGTLVSFKWDRPDLEALRGYELEFPEARCLDSVFPSRDDVIAGADDFCLVVSDKMVEDIVGNFFRQIRVLTPRGNLGDDFAFADSNLERVGACCMIKVRAVPPASDEK